MRVPEGPRRTEVEGLAVYLRGSSDAATAVILVHGAMDRAASFSRCMRRLSVPVPSAQPFGNTQAVSEEAAGQGVLAVAYDRRGYAGSLEAGTAPTIRDHSEDLASVVARFADKRVLVVGHSLGGTIAMDAASGLLSNSNLVGVASYESPRPWVGGLDGGEGLDTIAVGNSEGSEAGAEHFYRSMVGEQVWDRLRESDRGSRRAEGVALLAELIAVRELGFAVHPDAIEAPLFCAMGSLSSGRIKAATLDLAEDANIEPTIFEGAGHGAHLSHPNMFVAWIRAMLTAAVPGGRQ